VLNSIQFGNILYQACRDCNKDDCSKLQRWIPRAKAASPENADASLGKLKKSDMGSFQIIAQNSSEDFHMADVILTK
jgi:hypothetical protein